MKILFNADTHTYYDDTGREVPGVTRVLRLLGAHDSIPERIREQAMERGRRIHWVCEYDDRGWLDESRLADDMRPYLAAWRAWRADVKPTIEQTELMVWSAKYRYAGRIDRVAMIRGVRAILDIKTGAPPAITTGPQLAAYLTAWNEQIPDARALKRFAVHLTKDGDYKMIEHKKTGRDMSVFLSCLQIYRLRPQEEPNAN